MKTFKQFIAESLDKFVDDMRQKHGIELSLHKTTQGHLHINMIAVPKEKRKQGIGTAAMRDIAQYADDNNLKTTLQLGQKDDRWGTTSSKRLEKFYKSHGFVSNKGRNKDFSLSASMYREPKNRAPS